MRFPDRLAAWDALPDHFARSPPPPRRGHDAAFREGWSLLQKERYAEASEALAGIPPAEFDLGDYVVYFRGKAAARVGKRTEAGELLRILGEKFSDSPLLPYLLHEVAYAAALDNDAAAAREAFGLSRGKVSGSRRKAEEGYVAAFLAGEEGPTAEAATLHLENFSTYAAREAGILSFERLWKWRADGLLAGWDLSPGSTRSSPRRPPAPGKRNGRGRSSKRRSSVSLPPGNISR